MISSLAAALLVSATGAEGSQPPLSATSVLSANHAAMGDLPASGSARLDYGYAGSGLEGVETSRFDLASGAYVESQDAGGLHNSDGFDGKVPWQQDISLAYTPQMGGDRLPMAVDAAYRNANLWWRADQGGARISYIGREADGERAMDHLSVTPRGGKRFDAWFDVSTHLLAKIVYDQQFLHVTQTFSDYRREGGLMSPYRIVSDPGLGKAGLETLVLTRLSVGPAEPLSAYAAPTKPPTGASIVGGAATTTVPFRLLNNHIYVEARVDGAGPYTFIVDTGGHTLLSPRLIKAIGLKTVGEAVSSGAGPGHATTGFVHFGEIAIGDLRLKDQVGFATDIYDRSIEGIPIDGMVGFELIRRMVTTIDYGKKLITFSDPARFKPGPASGVPVPFVFYDHLPFVAGSVAGLPANFDIDTGSRSQIDLTSPFVKDHDLRSRFSKGVSAVVGWGVGGPSRSYMVRLTSLNLGPLQVDGAAGGLVEDTAGSMADPNYDGNVGGGLLKQFVVTFDYAHQIMYLKRIAPTPPDVGTFDRSGLWINAQDGGFDVTDVARDSAGAIAGIVVGDVITAVDGKPAVAEQLADVRRTLRERPAGAKVALTVRRGGETHAVVLVLRDQI